MPFPANTILTRHEPVEKDEFGVNKLRIIGPSPIHGGDTLPEWKGKDGQYYIVAPVDTFAANQVAPESLLMTDYDAEYPEEEEDTRSPAEVAAAKRQKQESPEAVFARKAREARTAAKKASAKASA